MPRIRTIKPEAFRSRTIKKLSFPARWTFEGLLVHSDDKGRSRYDTDLIRADIYPLELDEISVKDVESHIQEMLDAEMLCCYGVDGTRYLHFIKFQKHQRINRPSDSHFPECPYHGDDGSPRPGATPPEPKFTEPSTRPHAPLTEPSVRPQPSRVRAGSGSGGDMEVEKELAPLATVTLLPLPSLIETAAVPQAPDGALFEAPTEPAPNPRGGKKPKKPAAPKSPEEEALDKLAAELTREWYEALPQKPLGNYIGRRQIIRALLVSGHRPDDIAEAAKRCGVSLTGNAMEYRLAQIIERRSAAVPFQRHSAYVESDDRVYGPLASAFDSTGA